MFIYIDDSYYKVVWLDLSNINKQSFWMEALVSLE